jgi:hypothetical protein
MTTRVPKATCPNCKEQLNSASSLETEEGPSPGDMTMCLYCGHLMIFAPDFSFRALTQDEMHEIAGDPRVIQIMKFRAAFMKERERRNETTPDPRK